MQTEQGPAVHGNHENLRRIAELVVETGAAIALAYPLIRNAIQQVAR